MEPVLSTREYLNGAKVPQVLVATGDSYWGAQFKKYPWTIGFQPDYPGESKIYGQYINKNIPGVHASTVTGGGEQNLVKIQRGEVEISIIYTYDALKVLSGKGELKVPAPDLRPVRGEDLLVSHAWDLDSGLGVGPLDEP